MGNMRNVLELKCIHLQHAVYDTLNIHIEEPKYLEYAIHVM